MQSGDGEVPVALERAVRVGERESRVREREGVRSTVGRTWERGLGGLEERGKLILDAEASW